PCLVRDDPRRVVLAQRVAKLRPEPMLVADLDGKLHVLRPAGEERFQAGQKRRQVLAGLGVEITELQNAAKEFLLKQASRCEKQLHFLAAVLKQLFVRNRLRDFEAE